MANTQIIYCKISELVPYARNARTHSDEQVAQIAASIREFGWTNPVLIDGENGIIAGHGRVLAARKLNMGEVPTIELAHLSDVQRRAYILADNKLALNAEWDEKILAIEMESLAGLGFSDILTIRTDTEFAESVQPAELLSNFETEAPDDERDRELAADKADPIMFPIYAVLTNVQHKAWRQMRGELSDTNFIARLIEDFQQ